MTPCHLYAPRSSTARSSNDWETGTKQAKGGGGGGFDAPIACSVRPARAPTCPPPRGQRGHDTPRGVTCYMLQRALFARKVGCARRTPVPGPPQTPETATGDPCGRRSMWPTGLQCGAGNARHREAGLAHAEHVPQVLAVGARVKALDVPAARRETRALGRGMVCRVLGLFAWPRRTTGGAPLGPQAWNSQRGHAPKILVLSGKRKSAAAGCGWVGWDDVLQARGVEGFLRVRPAYPRGPGVESKNRITPVPEADS